MISTLEVAQVRVSNGVRLDRTPVSLQSSSSKTTSVPVWSNTVVLILFVSNTELQKAKSKAQISNNLKEEANLCNQLGELLAKNGNE